MTSHTYDRMDRLASRTDPVNASESFQYDGVGNLTRRTDRKGQVATFSYDGVNRRTGASYADGSAISFSYDAVSRLTQATDSVGGTVEHTYDALDRLLAQSGTLGTVSYQYDALGRRTTMIVPGQPTTSYGYDAASRVTGITQGSQAVAFQYDAASRRTLLTLPNQASTESQYDAASRLTALIYRTAAGQLGDLTYQYDAAGNRTRIGGAFARTLLPEAVASATYDAANRQSTFGSLTLSYDANGNLASDGTTTYAWDVRDRLSSLIGPVATASFQYDPLGRRAQKTLNGAQTRFGYDSLNPIQELAGSSAVANLLTGLGIDEYFTRTDAAGPRALLADALGSTVAELDATATLQAQFTYEPFGKTSVTGTTSDSYQYTGREADGPTALYYYRKRYYSSTLHRFLSEDPLALIRTGNAYQYAANSPITFSDPSGLLEFSTFGGLQLRASGPFGGFDTALGFRSGTEGLGGGRIEGFANARALATGGAAAGRGFFVGAALRDVSKLVDLTEVFVDTPFGGISLLFDGNELVGGAIAGPSAGVAIGAFLPTFPSIEIARGISFPTDLSGFLLPPLGGPGLATPAIGARK